MPDNAFYVYGVVRSEGDLTWQETGIAEENVYAISEGEFSALVHNCEEKPYIPEDPNKIKELIIAHNKILDKAMAYLNGVIPLSFNTIIKKGENLPEHNLKKWLNDDKERLEEIWTRIKGKREYGIRIYYEKDKLVQEISNNAEIKEIEEKQQGKSQGISYLLQGKMKSKTNELVQNRINQFKQKFFDDIKRITGNIKLNVSRISIDEEKHLLVSLSVLIDEQQINKIKEILEADKDFSFQLAGPFAPYSFVEK